MEQLVQQLMQGARREQVVLQQALDNGMTLLAYPLPQGAVIALGYTREEAHRVQADTVLRRRSAALARCGAWQPAMLADGGWFLARRVDARADDSLPALGVGELQAALELLA